MPIDDTNLYPSIQSGQQQGVRNALVRREVAQENELRKLIADYTMPGGSPEERQNALLTLTQADPAAARNVMQTEQLQRQQALDEQVRAATEGYGMANYLLTASDPVRGLEILDDDGEVRRQAVEWGLDPENPDDVLEIARALEAQYGMVAGLGSPERAAPAAIREMQMLGFDMTPEGFEQYNQARGGRGLDPFGDLERALTLQLLQSQVDTEAAEVAAAEEEARQERLTLEGNIRSGLGQISKITDNAMRLEGTLLEAGAPYSEMRRAISGGIEFLQSAAGFDASERRELNDSFDTMRKNMNDQLISLMSTGELGEATNAKLQQYKDSLANPDIGIGAIMDIEAGIAETLLQQADNIGYEVPDREKYEAAIDRIHQYQSGAVDPLIDVPGLTGAARTQIRQIGSMSYDQLESWIDSIDADTPAEVVRAALSRAEALENARTE